MKWRQWLFEEWKMTGLKLDAGFLEMEFAPQQGDAEAAWDLYVELLTRIATQPLPDEAGDEKAALESVYALFGLTRQVLKSHGRGCQEFARLAIVVLNQVVRPFTAEWHRRSLAGDLDRPEACAEFREALRDLQVDLDRYTGMLGEMAGVETDLRRLRPS